MTHPHCSISLLKLFVGKLKLFLQKYYNFVLCHSAKVRKNIEICKYSYILFLVILLIYNMLIFPYRYYRLSLFLYFMLFRQIPLMMAGSVLYGILHCLFLGSKNGNSKVPRSSRFWYSRKPSPSHLSNFTCWRFLEKKMNTAPPSGGSSISVLTI